MQKYPTSVVPIPPACRFNTNRINTKSTKYMIVPRTTISSNEFCGVKMPRQSIFQNISPMVVSHEDQNARDAQAFVNAYTSRTHSLLKLISSLAGFNKNVPEAFSASLLSPFTLDLVRNKRWSIIQKKAKEFEIELKGSENGGHP